MNPNLQLLANKIREYLDGTEDVELIKSLVKKLDKEITILEFKLDRTEKVKRTTSVLLEETIEELEQKRKDVEAQNRALEIEASLERVRAKAMAMMSSNDLDSAVSILVKRLRQLNIHPIRCGFGKIVPETRTTRTLYPQRGPRRSTFEVCFCDKT